MENYHRRPNAKKSKFEDAEDAGSGNNNSNNIIQSRNGIMNISPNGKVRIYVTRGLEVLQGTAPQSNPADGSNPSSSSSSSAATAGTPKPSAQIQTNLKMGATPPPGVLILKAQGRSITKAVTVAEILKRRMEGTLHQFTEIGQITEEEVWEPNSDRPDLDLLTVSRHRPTIRIRLSKELQLSSSPSPSQSQQQSAMVAATSTSIAPTEGMDQDELAKHQEMLQTWPVTILERDAAARRLVGYQEPTGNDIYM